MINSRGPKNKNLKKENLTRPLFLWSCIKGTITKLKL